jgi:hypothetical protein
VQQKLRCGSQLVYSFIKLHKQKLHHQARQHGLLHPIHPGTNEWFVRENQRKWAAEQNAEDKKVRENEKVQMQVMKDLHYRKLTNLR